MCWICKFEQIWLCWCFICRPYEQVCAKIISFLKLEVDPLASPVSLSSEDGNTEDSSTSDESFEHVDKAELIDEGEEVKEELPNEEEEIKEEIKEEDSNDKEGKKEEEEKVKDNSDKTKQSDQQEEEPEAWLA